MCAIIDNNVRHEVFGENPTEAGNFFLVWLDRKGQLVVGGKLLQELLGYRRFEMWLRVASRLGRAIRFADETVDTDAQSLRDDGICRSNDEHVLALARVSGARLLFTNDGYLQGDFKNPEIIDGVRGRVYTTQLSKDVRRAHRDLLNRNDLCAARG